MPDFNEIVDRFERARLTKLRYKDADFELELVREGEGVAPAVRKGPAVDAIQDAPQEESRYEAVRSPIVGIFYSSPSPEEANFTEVGSRVSKGDTLCILEAMKLFNELKAPIDGIVRKIHVKNEDLVGEGDVLFELEPC